MDEFSIYIKSKHMLSDKCKGLSINDNTIITVLKYAMEIVEFTTIKGDRQKIMVLDLIKDIINDAPFLQNMQRVRLETLCSLYGPLSHTIDLVIAGTKGELDINTTLQTTTSCINGCCVS